MAQTALVSTSESSTEMSEFLCSATSIPKGPSLGATCCAKSSEIRAADGLGTTQGQRPGLPLTVISLSMPSRADTGLCERKTAGSGKITHRTKDAKKSPPAHSQKSPARHTKNSPSYYNQGGVSVVSEKVLRELLRKYNQDDWTTCIRVEGLQLLLNHCVSRSNKAGFCISTGLAEQCVSEIKYPRAPETIRSPLAVLCKIGLLVQTHPSVRSWHVKQSARFQIHPSYATERHYFPLSPRQQRKLLQADCRRESRLNHRYPVREGILNALQRLSFANTARPKIPQLLEVKAAATKQVVRAIDRCKHSVTFDKVGQITTSISSLPRELKEDLLIEDEEAIFADLSHAHHCFLPRLVSDRIDYHRRRAISATCFLPNGSVVTLFLAWNTQPGTVARLEIERLRLIEFLSNGDFYTKIGRNGETRESVKKLANTVLNFTNKKAAKIPLYRFMRQKFPATFGIVEDIKQKDHRNLSNSLRHYTAESIECTLLHLQSNGFLVIPQTDALLCKMPETETVSRAFGTAVFNVSTGLDAVLTAFVTNISNVSFGAWGSGQLCTMSMYARADFVDSDLGGSVICEDGKEGQVGPCGLGLRQLRSA